MVIHRLTKADAYDIFRSTSSPRQSACQSQFNSEIDKLFGLKFDSELHKNKFRTLQKLFIKERRLDSKLRNKFEEHHWKDTFYDCDMAHTILVPENVSDDEENDDDNQETASPALKKFRKSIMLCSRQAQNKRTDELYSQLQLNADAEGITPVQLSAMLLYRAAYMKNKDISEVADTIAKGTFSNTSATQKLSVESASLLMSTLEIGKTPYIKMRGIFKSELGSAIIPSYELVSGFNTSITPVCQALSDQFTGVRYPLLPAITTTCQRQLSVLDVDVTGQRVST